MKQEYIELFYQMYDEKVNKDQFIKSALEWDFHPVVKGNKVVALIVTKDNRIHCGCLPTYKGKWFPRKYVNNLFKDMIDKYGSVITSTTEKTRDFVERLGFKEIGRSEEVV